MLPTCLAAAGIEEPLPEGANGRDCSPKKPSRKSIFSQDNRQFGVFENNRNEAFTSQGPAELFDLENDSIDTRDLSAADPAPCRAMRAGVEAERAAKASPVLGPSREIPSGPARSAEEVRR